MVKKVAVIGAGVSGLASLKCCLDEGLEPTCFERGDDIGGLWKFMEHLEEARASIYKSVVTNTSKEMTCFSDFPMPDRFPNFLPNYKLMEYFKMYAKHFDLLRHIQFKTVVHSVRKCPDFSTTGQWDIVTEKDGKQKSHIFDAVLVCIGHHVEPYLPLDSFPGIERFKGQYFHSREYKFPDGFKGKRVIIVGMGNSGADLAVELSHTADKVFLSTRRGSWVMSRVYDRGYPWDMVFNTRFKNWFRNALPSSIAIWMTDRKMNSWFDHANYGLHPQDSSQWKEPLFNDELPSRITCGYVVTKPNVTQFTETSASFEDGTVEEDIDVVVFATGYTYSCPLLEDCDMKNENINSLYRRIFPPNLEKPTLGVIGLIQPIGSIMPTTEMQARWATRIFKGLCKLPSLEEIRKDIAKKKEILVKRYAAQGNCAHRRHSQRPHLQHKSPGGTSSCKTCSLARHCWNMLCYRYPAQANHAHRRHSQRPHLQHESPGGASCCKTCRLARHCWNMLCYRYPPKPTVHNATTAKDHIYSTKVLGALHPARPAV